MGWRRGLGLSGGVIVLVVVLASCAQPNTGSLGIQGAAGRPVSLAGLPSAPVCPGPVALGNAGCTSRVILNKRGVPLTNPSPAGYSPSDIKGAYGFSSLSQTGNGTTIAIVDAYDDPNAQTDLDTFKSQFGIAGSACPLTKVDQNGGSHYPHTDSGWALEISLDVQWACAIAPQANILLVEAKSSSFGNLMTAVQYAENHANVVSMSWGGSEFSSEASYDTYFQKSGVTFTASSGDNGAGVIYPAASPYVLGVGGTTLAIGTNSISETAWSGSGGGVSAYESMPGYQSNLSSGTGDLGSANGSRGVPDVAYDADPNTGVAVYDSTGYQGVSGWFVLGGTSVGAPNWAALFALADQYHQTSLSGTSDGSVGSLTSPTYSAANANYGSDFNDIQTGSDCTSGSTSTVSPANPGHGKGGPPSGGGGSGGGGGSTSLCTAGTGYDFVTGLGSPQADSLVPHL